jgi:hypothetical protein
MEKRLDITSLLAQARIRRMWRLYGQQHAVAAGRPVPEMVILDANILVRAVLGNRVREILETHSARVRFFAPDTGFAEAREHLPGRIAQEAMVLIPEPLRRAALSSHE